MRPPPAHSRRFLRWALAACGGAVLLLGIAVPLGWKWAVAHYLESDSFLATLNHAAGQTLHADVMFSPLHVSAETIASQGVEAHGSTEAAFARLEMNGLHAKWSMRRLLDRVCQIDEVSADEVLLHFEGARIPPVHEPPPPPPSAWMPNRVALHAFTAQTSEFSWEGGALRGAEVKASTEEEGPLAKWAVTAHGGTFQQGNLTPLALDALKLRWPPPSLYVNSATLHQGAAGVVTVSGTVQPGESLDLFTEWQHIPVGTLLSPDWRMRVSGDLSGEAKIRSTLPGTPGVTGHWSLAHGKLEALPVLEQLAAFTHSTRFRQLALDRAEGDFRWSADQLELSNLRAESTGLARLEGGFTVTGGQLHGDLQIGIAPPLVPGVSTALALFGVTRDGYVWTTLHLDGPLADPGEDLTARLAQAMAGHAVEAAGQAAGAVKETAKDAAKGVLDLFFGR